MNSRAKRQYLTVNVNGVIRRLQVDEVEGFIEFSAGTLPCRFGRVMRDEICGQPQNKRAATGAILISHILRALKA